MVQYNNDRPQHGNEEGESVGKRVEEGSLDWMNKLRILRDEIRSCKVENEMMVKAEERQVEVNSSILQSFSYLKRKDQHELGASHRNRKISTEKEENNN